MLKNDTINVDQNNLQKEKEIENIKQILSDLGLKPSSHNTYGYIIRDDLVVDFIGDLNISDRELTDIPVKFGHIRGSFFAHSNKLKTLHNAPDIVEGILFVPDNLLTDLTGIPKKIGHICEISRNQITSLDGIENLEVGSTLVYIRSGSSKYGNQGIFTEKDFIEKGVKANLIWAYPSEIEDVKTQSVTLGLNYELIEYTFNADEVSAYAPLIIKDFAINYDGNVDISDKQLTEIPFKFGHIKGDFIARGGDLDYSNKFTSFKNVPDIVDGNFQVTGNLITNFKEIPKKIGGYCDVSRNNITSLEGINYLEVGGTFMYIRDDIYGARNPGVFTKKDFENKSVKANLFWVYPNEVDSIKEQIVLLLLDIKLSEFVFTVAEIADMKPLITGDISIDYNGDIRASAKGLKEIPIKFGYVKGDFIFNANHLNTLDNAPDIIDGNFSIIGSELVNLVHIPKYIGGSCDISSNNIVSLEGIDNLKVGGTLIYIRDDKFGQKNPGIFTEKDFKDKGVQAELFWTHPKELSYIKEQIIKLGLNLALVELGFTTREVADDYPLIFGDIKIDYNGNIDIADKGLFEIPFKFGHVKGNFYAWGGFNSWGSIHPWGNRLTSLKNAPDVVDGDFHVARNKIANFHDIPKKIGGYCDISRNRNYSIDGIDNLEVGGTLMYVRDDKHGPRNPGVFTKQDFENRGVNAKLIWAYPSEIDNIRQIAATYDFDIDLVEFSFNVKEESVAITLSISNLVTHYNGDILLNNRGLTELPFKFGHVKGSFVAYSNKLITLKNSPDIVDGDFHVALNNLKNINGITKKIGKHCDISRNNIISLEGVDNLEVGGTLMYVRDDKFGPRNPGALTKKDFENKNIKAKLIWAYPSEVDSIKEQAIQMNFDLSLIKYNFKVIERAANQDLTIEFISAEYNGQNIIPNIDIL